MDVEKIVGAVMEKLYGWAMTKDDLVIRVQVSHLCGDVEIRISVYGFKDGDRCSVCKTYSHDLLTATT